MCMWVSTDVRRWHWSTQSGVTGLESVDTGAGSSFNRAVNALRLGAVSPVSLWGVLCVFSGCFQTMGISSFIYSAAERLLDFL